MRSRRNEILQIYTGTTVSVVNQKSVVPIDLDLIMYCIHTFL